MKKQMIFCLVLTFMGATAFAQKFAPTNKTFDFINKLPPEKADQTKKTSLLATYNDDISSYVKKINGYYKNCVGVEAVQTTFVMGTGAVAVAGADGEAAAVAAKKAALASQGQAAKLKELTGALDGCAFTLFPLPSVLKNVKGDIKYKQCMHEDVGEDSAFPEVYKEYANEIHDIGEKCDDAFGALEKKYMVSYNTIINGGKKASFAKTALLATAGAGAAYLVGKELFGGKGDKDKEDKKDTSAEDYANGVITLEDGKKLECFTNANYQRSECLDTMKRLCQSSEKETTGGCNQFNNYFCAATGSGVDSMYCLYSDATSYCKQSGDYVSQSPACQWKNSRSADCAKDPEGLTCRVAMTVDQLTAACKNFPYDPICKANANNKTVTQPDSAVADNGAEDANTETDNSIKLGVTSSYGSSSSSSSSPGMGLASVNMFQDNSAKMRSMCLEGRLATCPY